MVKVKICGLMDQTTVEAVCALGADYLGFVFAKSKREVQPEAVAQMTKQVPSTIQKVGVFVSPTLDQVNDVIRRAGLDLVQIHGELSFETCEVPIIQAKSVDKQLTLDTKAEYLLLDAPPKEYYGGNGTTFAWERVNPASLPKERLFIAGGLTTENVGQAITYFHPYAVDVSSSVETEGKKDLKKIQQFIETVKENDYVSTTR